MGARVRSTCLAAILMFSWQAIAQPAPPAASAEPAPPAASAQPAPPAASAHPAPPAASAHPAPPAASLQVAVDAEERNWPDDKGEHKKVHYFVAGELGF